MIQNTIQQTTVFKIEHSTHHTWFYGCHQDLYPSKWKRLAGCGPSVASNLVLYYKTKKDLDTYHTKDACINLMNDVWKYVTPGFQGVSSTQHFNKGILKYSGFNHLTIQTHFIDISKTRETRLKLPAVIQFIQNGLEADSPIAFLNLHNGEEKALDQWHWVTIVGLRIIDDPLSVMIEILDAGKQFEINLALWLETTQLGGGFVYIT
jgi:hypothetical protein